MYSPRDALTVPTYCSWRPALVDGGAAGSGGHAARALPDRFT